MSTPSFYIQVIWYGSSYFENLVAELCDGVILFLESYGASCELGDVYYTVDHYKGIFELSNEVFKLKKAERREELLELLNDYFRAGLPKDITNTIDSQVLPLLGEDIGVKG